MNRVFFSFGKITIYWYSIMILLAVLTAAYVIMKEAKRQNKKTYFDNLIFYLVIIGIIGARIYYVIFQFDSYRYNLLDILKIWEGGLAIYGGIIAGALFTVCYTKKYKEKVIKTTDILVPGLIIGQAIGRWGNFFNGEAHGTQVSLAFLQRLHIPKFIINGMYINNTYYHPTFLYESIWCSLGFIILLIVRKIVQRKKDILTYIYFIWYGVGRFLIESLRTDSLYIGKIRISQLVSLILIILGIIGIIINLIKTKKEVKE